MDTVIMVLIATTMIDALALLGIGMILKKRGITLEGILSQLSSTPNRLEALEEKCYDIEERQEFHEEIAAEMKVKADIQHESIQKIFKRLRVK
jgi:hypothetical protein